MRKSIMQWTDINSEDDSPPDASANANMSIESIRIASPTHFDRIEKTKVRASRFSMGTNIELPIVESPFHANDDHEIQMMHSPAAHENESPLNAIIRESHSEIKESNREIKETPDEIEVDLNFEKKASAYMAKAESIDLQIPNHADDDDE